MSAPTATPTRPESEAGTRLLGPAYAATTIGMFALIAFVAFEAMAVTTVMPTVARELDGISLYALSFAAPLASGVVGMVAAGMWSDRRGPVIPLLAALAMFSLGLLVCGTASSMEMLVVGRVLQGLGGGALTVGLYVVVGLVFPAALQPAVFASFAAAWVLPALFGPALAASVAAAVGWRWVFLGTVGARGARRTADRPGAARARGVVLRRPGAPVAAGLGGRRRDRRAGPRAARLRWRCAGGGAGRRRARGGGARPAPAAPGRHPGRAARTAGGDRHPRPDERRVLLRGGLHRLRAPGPLGAHTRAGRAGADRGRRRLGAVEPAAGPPRHPGLARDRDALGRRPGAGRDRRADAGGGGRRPPGRGRGGVRPRGRRDGLRLPAHQRRDAGRLHGPGPRVQLRGDLDRGLPRRRPGAVGDRRGLRRRHGGGRRPVPRGVRGGGGDRRARHAHRRPHPRAVS